MAGMRSVTRGTSRARASRKSACYSNGSGSGAPYVGFGPMVFSQQAGTVVGSRVRWLRQRWRQEQLCTCSYLCNFPFYTYNNFAAFKAIL